ncbi:hypothetical protein BJ944DRAFT_154177 [Cunninghamella echinulata]|nr:hypothetical protein BJ944DRAFT_154177 [Cunninghamella echinulata]
MLISVPQPQLIPPNDLNPRQQEEADQPVREGMRYLFDNRFARAKAIFQLNSSSDPLYSLGLGVMAFMKAIMSHGDRDIQLATQTLNTTFMIAQAQIDNTKKRKSKPMSSFAKYFSENITVKNDPTFIANGILRAHVIKAEASLLMGILQLLHESIVNYIKCCVYLRRAYKNYNIVWKEYKKMGQEYTKYMDCDTVSGIQFGIGAVQLILSSMPTKLSQINSILGWDYNKGLGLSLLKLCIQCRGIRSSLSSIILLSYYTILTSFTPQLYTEEYLEPAIECLTGAQKQHPKSCIFLFFAAKLARIANNLTLSSQSFHFAAESSRGEWGELAIKQLADYEIAFNDTLQLNWEDALTNFSYLHQQGYWSIAFSKYMMGACYEMMGKRTESILAFAEIPQLIQRTIATNHVSSGNPTTPHLYVDCYIQKKVDRFQQGGYQYMDLYLPALEMLLLCNLYEWMDKLSLEHCLTIVQYTLELIYEREKLEYNLRLKELMPSTLPPNYYDHRAVLLLIKATIFNALKKPQECISHLNWIIDHQQHIKYDLWVIPYAYWESGVTCWHLGKYKKSRELWQKASNCSNYDFEHRLTIRLSLALSKCDDMGIAYKYKSVKGKSSNGRKRMPLA